MQALEVYGLAQMLWIPLGRLSTFSTLPLADMSRKPELKVDTRKLLLDTRLSIRGCSLTRSQFEGE